jgi:hypothetical protein
MSDESEQHTYDQGIYPGVPDHAVPEPIPLVSFAPWHLPRKQWVRNNQWRGCTKRLVRDLHLGDRPLRYLGLPGTELLDLEVLANFCTEKALKFRYLGFNSGAQSPGQQTTQQLAEDLLKSMDSVDAGSIVAADDIIALASKTSLAYNRLRGYESFDVINLDLCDVFTTRRGRSVHAAVKNIVEFQVNGRTQPWLLFITTAIDRDAVAPDDIAQYGGRFDENLNRCQEFRDLASEIVGQQVNAPGSGSSAFASADGVRFGKLLSVSIGKWLASLLRQPVTWKVELKSCACYRRGMPNMRVDMPPVPEPELFSLVFGVTRSAQELTDPSGLAGSRSSLVHLPDWNEVERLMALQMVRKAQRAIDLDLHLQSRPGEYQQLTEEAGALLAFRSYDIQAYRKFAASVPQIPVSM